MKIKAEFYRNLLLGFISILLVVPVAENITGIVKVKNLAGFEGTRVPNINFRFKNWFLGNYQEKKEAYVDKDFGFRNIFIRINNQIQFNLFNKAVANGVIVGKEDYLYESNYVTAYYGDDFIGKDSVLHRIQKLKFIQDTLAKLNKTLILIFAPGKGSYYPEYIPDDYKSEKKTTNYQCYAEDAKRLGINYIDFNKYFLDNKSKSKYSLYPRYGIHWSFYGECLAADSIIKYIEFVRHIKMSHVSWDSISIHYPDSTSRDDDIENGMNLLLNLKQDKMAYPVLKIKTDSTKVRPSALVIADSFYWGMFSWGFIDLFSVNHFWFYNKQIYPESYKTALTTDQVDLKNEILKHDIVLIISSESNLPKLGWGFIENAYAVFHGQKTENYDSAYIKKLAITINNIKQNKEWVANIAKGANEKNIPLDSAIKLNAIYVIQNEKKKN